MDDTVEEIERKFPFHQASLGDRFTRLNFQPTLLVLYQKCIKMLPRKYTIQFITCITEIIFKANIQFKLKSKVFCIGPPGHENGSDNGTFRYIGFILSVSDYSLRLPVTEESILVQKVIFLIKIKLCFPTAMYTRFHCL